MSMVIRVACAIALLPLATATAEPVIQLTNAATGETFVNTSPGQQFTISATLESDVDFVGLSFVLEVADGGNGLFSIVGRQSSVVNPFDELTTPNDADVIDSGTLMPRNGHDLGYFNDSRLVSSGSYQIVDLLMQVDPDALNGDYTIQTAEVSVSDLDFNDFFANSFPVLNITVVPEPSALVLLLPGVVWLLRRRAT